ncbi:MAG: hypothetical protein ACP5VS_12610 [Desulfomonilaceae bacterium]
MTYFSSVKPDLFEFILRKFNPTMGKNPGSMSWGSFSTDAGANVSEEN